MGSILNVRLLSLLEVEECLSPHVFSDDTFDIVGGESINNC